MTTPWRTAVESLTEGGVYFAADPALAPLQRSLLRNAIAYTRIGGVIAYSTCIAHGIDLGQSMAHQKDAVRSGYWPLYRFHPSEIGDGVPFKLDSAKPTLPVADFIASETRFGVLARTQPARAAELSQLIQQDVDERWRYYEQLAKVSPRARYWKIGTTEEGRDIVALAIADEATIKSLEKYRDQLAALTDPATRLVSLTVTEKGYCHDPATGALNPEDIIFKFDGKTGAILERFGGGMITMPHGIYVDKEDNVWAVDEGANMVVKYRPDGSVALTLL